MGGGHVKFYSYVNWGGGGGGGKVLAMLKGGTISFGVVRTRQLEVLAILKGGVFKKGGMKSLTLS